MAYAKLITTEYLYANTRIDKDVDPDDLNQAIEEAQDINIQELLGSTLYQKIMNDIATTGTCTGMYYRLLTEHIQPTQTKWVLVYALPDLNYHLTNKSVSEKSSEYSKPTELQTLQYLTRIAESKAESYGEKLRNFIKKNIQSFPEIQQDSGFDVRPEEQNFWGGMYLPKRRNC